MSARRAAASERRRSIEVREVNTEMGDDADGVSSDSRREAGREDQEGAEGDDQKRDMLQLIQTVSTFLCSVKENGEELAAGFQRIPNRRVLPDYFEIISDPVAFSTVRGKVQRKQYTSFAEFVKDVAQICHNAQVYNRPSAPIFGAAVRLREVFRGELKKLVNNGDISASDATIPDLGELPPAEESSSRGSEAGDVDGEEEDEDEDDDDEEGEEEEDDDDEEEEESDDEGGPRDRDHDKYEYTHKKRGRPPMVLTPMEARISSILKGLRKFKDHEGGLLILAFEKLPDKASVADYYQTITNPIALDNIKRKAKRKKYHDVDQVLADIELMFENAKLYNEDDSEVFQAAVELQRQARLLAEQEKGRPDDDFRDEDGKLPLAEAQHNGQAWKIGDWVHIRNPNDLAKPIVAQIFRTWQDRAGQKWINACWYYRPEQTVHRHEKHFFEREVVKTGQYRDHQIGDVLDRCFVMFVTRFNKGRPRGFPPDKDVYVCESRYNEEKFRFNKIKTWASCVPDEVREKDYEMDLFDAPSRMRKIPSPIKHLLREDAKETDELPRPIWGSPNAPPIIGAVHRRLPEPNESPPPEPTPPPPVPAAADVRSSMFSVVRDGPAEATVRGPFHGPGPASPPASGVSPMHQTPVPIPHPPHHAAPAPPHMPIRPMHYQHPHPHPHPHPHQHLQHPQHQLQQQQPQAGYVHNYSAAAAAHQQPMGTPLAAGNSSQVQLPQSARAALAPVTGSTTQHATVYNPPRPPEVYTLTDGANDALPTALRQGFQHDDAGRVLFFTAPPLDHKKRKCRDEAARKPEVSQKRMATDEAAVTEAADPVVGEATNAMNEWFRQLDHETHEWRRNAGLEGWSNVA
ncbi:bromodomain-containing protein [Hirsutella rhossiliensis]|uniref:Bromodomain-containing protein n=1 Tax=Hirsutella rhossiliensis TaxID=111463 RepID=A0A9P8SEV8_9HYPO|nr:bromodomain-containing protein [Hirsutella rhossiliensis]KAH0960076.1 bromodomain-containing protein [Hirsutella rhossiliensis]